MNEKDQAQRCANATAEGLVLAYFPNGTALEMFVWRCDNCRHCIDDRENPKPGRLTPPFTCCTWGVLDSVYFEMAHSRFGYGKSAHKPEDVQVRDDDGSWLCPPHCKRYTPKDYPSDDRDPPRPDVPGQMLLDEIDVPVEVTMERRVVQESPR